MPIEWTRAATDHLIRQRRILLSGEMEEVEVAGPEQASVTIGLSEADSGSSPFSHDSRNEALPDNVFNNVLSEDVNMEDINHGDNDNNELILLEDGVVTESSDDDNKKESSGEEEDNNDKEEGSSYEEEGNNNEDDCNNDEEEHNYDEEKGDGNEEEVIHQIVKALDEDKIPSCDGEFVRTPSNIYIGNKKGQNFYNSSTQGFY
ncbi:hypothetical protein RhiirC2_823245 [Rhizophagus irregularis]|uniref:Uncharacterized protein n=1 Tax=Rhizophagus irregularis TaxID=588596 RepID=A0A2N1M9M2_9GLOM|nr:hypothetical protein RhiirC2_823245 [Rhizophagus irregularis]